MSSCCFILLCIDGEFVAAVLDEGIPALSASYNERFGNVFPIPSNYKATDNESLMAFSKAITSNLMGGVGYFYGTSLIDRGFAYEWDQDDDSDASESGERKGPTLVQPRGLLTATPSRSFFPRGFFWYARIYMYRSQHSFVTFRDEGFHLLHIGQYDNDLT